MGYNPAELRITARLSNHGSQQDKDDEADWKELVHRIRMICRESKYEQIEADVSNWS